MAVLAALKDEVLRLRSQVQSQGEELRVARENAHKETNHEVPQ